MSQLALTKFREIICQTANASHVVCRDCLKHSFHHFPFMIAFLSIYGVLIPLLMGLILFLKRKVLLQEDFLGYFGALTLPFRHRYGYWIIVDLFRRTFLVVLLQFFAILNFIFLQLFIVIALLFGYLLLIITFQPYASKRLNYLVMDATSAAKSSCRLRK